MLEKFTSFVHAGSVEQRLLEKIDWAKLPAHVAIIMDGNGRWAKEKNLLRSTGHQRGAETAREITECAARLGIPYLTLFAFSSENWKRPISEVRLLMDLLHENLVKRQDLLKKNGIRLNILGESGRLPKKLRDKLQETVDQSAKNRRMRLNLALSYGSRNELILAIRKIISNRIPARRITPRLLSHFLYTAGMPDPDLLIRTSGEYRISNFLLYQIAYTELYFTDTFWPDFKTKEFLTAILDFQARQRRFGSL